MMEPKFKHDWPNCEFLGHWFGHDVYLVRCGDPLDPSITARYGNEDYEYASSPLSLFVDAVKNHDHRISGGRMPFSMTFSDYLFSPYVVTYHKAWLLALAMREQK